MLLTNFIIIIVIISIDTVAVGDVVEMKTMIEHCRREQGHVLAVLATCHFLLPNREVSRNLIHSSLGRVSEADVSAAGGNSEVSI